MKCPHCTKENYFKLKDYCRDWGSCIFQCNDCNKHFQQKITFKFMAKFILILSTLVGVPAIFLKTKLSWDLMTFHIIAYSAILIIVVPLYVFLSNRFGEAKIYDSQGKK